jgi:hypothetical protein
MPKSRHRIDLAVLDPVSSIFVDLMELDLLESTRPSVPICGNRRARSNDAIADRCLSSQPRVGAEAGVNNAFTIFTGTANPALATMIAGVLGVPIGSCLVERYPDGNVAVRLLESVR